MRQVSVVSISSKNKSVTTTEAYLEPTRSVYFDDLRREIMCYLRWSLSGVFPSSTHERLPEGTIFIAIELGGGRRIFRWRGLRIGKKFFSLFAFALVIVLIGSVGRNICRTLAHRVKVQCIKVETKLTSSRSSTPSPAPTSPAGTYKGEFSVRARRVKKRRLKRSCEGMDPVAGARSRERKKKTSRKWRFWEGSGNGKRREGWQDYEYGSSVLPPLHEKHKSYTEKVVVRITARLLGDVIHR
jgi:hypothetical protein